MATQPLVSGTREQLYAERREMVRRGCEKFNRTIQDDYNSSHYLVEERHNILYCPIPKVGSTFWKKALTSVGSMKSERSMFEIKWQEMHLTKLSKLSKKEKENLKSGTSFLFIRDPYARLFSGYENKIYHCNKLFWGSTGHSVVQYTRKSLDKRDKHYGYNVSFPEFVSYILHLSDENKHINQHFAPMHKSCDPCAHKFHFIGKLETFKDDVDYLFDKWRHEFNDFHINYNDFERETALRTAYGHVRFLYGTKSILSEIKFPFRKLMLRTWRDLQIRGFMSKDVPFPFDENDGVDNVSAEAFMKMIEMGLTATTDRAAAKAQREEALIQAYRSVPLKDMERLRQYVSQDCQLFGFDDRPRKLFDRDTPIDESFLYLDGL